MKTKPESNTDQEATTVSGRLERRVILRMLVDHKSWKLRHADEKFEEVVHKDGWRYYTACGCVCIRNDNDPSFEQDTGIFVWPLYSILGYINARKARAR